MRTLLAAGAALFACTALAAGLLGANRDVAPSEAGSSAPSGRLVVHEWGTFTRFSGSDGVPVGFTPNNTDLPGFIYYQEADPNSKADRLVRDGTVSMETPVMYFYTDKETRASIRVAFPKGWITEWYPFAAAPPTRNVRQPRAPGQSVRWDVKLLAGESASLPRDKAESHYYQARETDAALVQAEVKVPEGQRDPSLRGGVVVEKEKFLFYRGVGAFAPPVAVRALDAGRVHLTNTAGVRVGGLMLVAAHGGKVGFRALGDLGAGAEATTTLPDADGTSADAAGAMVKNLIAAGLYEKEARAMVKTWESAWFSDEGDRLLYLEPRTRADELLPLTVEPKPAELVRVLVGRHDFLTPEQEANVDRLVQRARASQGELDAAEKALLKIGRFADQACQMATKRLEARTTHK
jgi:hypothetical protein